MTTWARIPVETIDDGGRAAREAHVDFLIGLGGGSAMDAAKAIAAAARATRSIWEYTSAVSEPRQTLLDALPVLQIPIVASTGSETNDVASILSGDNGVKAWLQSPHMLARVAIVDPALTFTVPKRYTAVGGMNIVSRMLETYLTGDEFPNGPYHGRLNARGDG
jgi:alcohol dehydrogenase class IV